MIGKKICTELKEIRKKIAQENDIEYIVSECQHKGECKGTCPKCEAEVRYLEEALKKRERLGKKIALVGISAGMISAISGCGPFDNAIFGDVQRDQVVTAEEVICGNMQYYPMEEELNTETKNTEASNMIYTPISGDVYIEEPNMEGTIE